jgi:hypothetical protein
MSNTGARPERRSPAALVGWVAVAAVTVTVAVTVLPFVRFAYRAPALHVALETGNALIALLVAFVVYGRYRQRQRLQELLMVLALCTAAVANLVLTALPTALSMDAAQEGSRWAGLIIRFLASVLFTAAALAPAAPALGRPRPGLVTLPLALAVVSIGVLGAALGDRLPPTVNPGQAVGDADVPELIAHPVVLAVQGLDE